MRLAAFIVMLIPLASCAPGVRAVPDERPFDLMLAATVFVPAQKRSAEGLPRSQRPGRYVIEADTWLRATEGRPADTETFPPRVRRLSGQQMEQLWRQLRESGLLDPGSSARIDGPEAAMPSPRVPVALIYASFGGTRRTVRIALDRSGPEAIEAERFVDRLAELAWAR